MCEADGVRDDSDDDDKDVAFIFALSLTVCFGVLLFSFEELWLESVSSVENLTMQSDSSVTGEQFVMTCGISTVEEKEEEEQEVRPEQTWEDT